MRILSWLFGGVAKVSKRDAEAVAEAIVARYEQRRIRGEFRVDDKLFLEVCVVLPEKAALEIVSRFRRRRARSDVRAEYKLGVEIGVALCDADAFGRKQPVHDDVEVPAKALAIRRPASSGTSRENQLSAGRP